MSHPACSKRTNHRASVSTWRSQVLALARWLGVSWEIYLIVLVAGFLRLYQLNTIELDEDQTQLFRLAHDSIVHGLLPVTSNASSIGIANPPAAIYLFMLPAALSANPLGAALLVGIFATIAVLLTYFFTRRYYGRLAGIIAAMLYATAAWPIFFARFIWQPNLTAYTYVFTASTDVASGQGKPFSCTFTAIRAGDQLLLALPLHGSALTLGIQSFKTIPRNPSYGPLHFETYLSRNISYSTLHAPDGKDTFTMPIS